MVMGRFGLVVLALVLSSFVSAQPVSPDKAREMYFGMTSGNCNSLKLAEAFEKNKPAQPLLKAYYGASAAAAPECVTNPATKISWFRKGKSLLDEAVKADPSNFEIRFLRFATQDKAPGFLGYNDNIKDDKDFIISNLAKGKSAVNNAKVFKEITGFLLKSDNLDQKEKKIVNDYLNTSK